jgi:Icc-related predicted phosphoesterase
VTPEQLAEFAADPPRVEAFFRQRMLELLEQWMALADQRLDGSSVRCYVCPGNDDTFETDEVIQRSRRVELAEGRAVDLGGGFSMVSTGWSNITPWHTCRELPEPELEAKIEGMLPPAGDMSHMVFNFHCPPQASGLDEAPALDEELNLLDAGRSLIPVGSTAVRQAIERHQPLLSLHGHIHEGKGIARLGRTLCINAGSLYEQGTLQGAVVELDRRKGIKSYMLTTG